VAGRFPNGEAMRSGSSAEILKVRNITKNFGRLLAVNNLSFSIEERKITGLIGPNGAGKTTLFNIITGIHKADGGSAFFRGRNITNLKSYQIARLGIGRTWQLIRIFLKMTVMENLLIAAKVAGEKEYRKAIELLELFGLMGERDNYAGELSTGQQKILSIARILMFDADLMLLDELAAGVNPAEQDVMMRHIHELCEAQGKTFLIIEHSMDVIMGHCDKVICMNFGEKIAEGSAAEIQRNERVIEAYFGT
jgi:ABC-type branched-subunit amino acid transport system ATPase component